VLRWAALDVDATGVDVATLTGRIADKVRVALAGADGRPVLARLTLTGASALHGTLIGDTDHLAAECRNAAIEEDAELWVESVRLRTSPVPLTKDDMLAPLRAAFTAGLDDPALVKSPLDDLASLRQRLPAPARDRSPTPQKLLPPLPPIRCRVDGEMSPDGRCRQIHSFSRRNCDRMIP